VGSRIAHNRCYTQQQLEEEREATRRLKDDISRVNASGVNIPLECGLAGTQCFGFSNSNGAAAGNPFQR